MKYHLKTIEHFWAHYLKPENSILERLDEPEMANLMLKLDSECEKIKMFMSETYYSYDEEKYGIYFIRNHQRRLTLMINQINEALRQDIMEAGKKLQISRQLSHRLLGLLNHLEKDYMHCIDSDQGITEAYGNMKASEFIKIMLQFNSNFCYSDPLMIIALEPVNTFIKDHKPGYTYSRVRYLNRLMKEMELLQRRDVYGYKTGLVDLLILLNFNNNSFFDYLTKMIKSDVLKNDEPKDHLIRLRWYRKFFRQKNTKRDIAFLPNRQNIKDQIDVWLEEEIKYLELTPSGLDNEKDMMSEENKIHLSISAERLAFLIKLAKETAIITNEELRPVISLICKFIATKKQGTLSVDSLYNKVYQIEINSPYIIQTELEVILKKYL